MFFDRYEQEDVKKYWETFLHKIKLFLLYFLKFFEDDIIILKEYSIDCVIEKPGKRPIIMIIHDKSTFSINDGYKKVWTLNS